MSLLAWPWPGDVPRRTGAALRYRMLNSEHDEDLALFIETLDGAQKLGAIGVVDTATNPLAAYARQLSVPGCYGVAPTIHGPDGADPLIARRANRPEAPMGALWRAGWAAIMPETEYYARGLGCVAVLPSVDAAFASLPAGPLSLRLVFPHNLHVLVHPDRPMVPVEVWELRQHKGGQVFYRWSIEDPAMPWFAVHRASEGGSKDPADIISEVMPQAGSQRGDEYPWRYGDGTPYIPHTFYRPSPASFWGDDRCRGLTRATLSGGRMTNYAVYGLAHSNNGGHLGVNCSPVGAASGQPLPPGVTRSLSIMPGSFTELQISDPSVPAQVVAVGPTQDPGLSFRAVQTYVGQLMSDLGLGGATSTRDHANPTSAAALSIDETDLRLQQRVGGESFGGSDQELLGKCAALMSSLPGAPSVPEQGYTLEYHLLPLTPQEREEQRDAIAFEVERGLLSRVDAYMRLHPGVDEEGAIAALQRVARLEALIRSPAPA